MQQTRLSTVLAVAFAVVFAWSPRGEDVGQVPLDALLSPYWHEPHPLGADGDSGASSARGCRTSRTTAFEQAAGPVSFSVSPAEHLEVPKLSAINATAWEQWEFDGIAASGRGSILMGFSRDASYAFFGQGNLRVEFYMMLDDGTVIQDLDYLDESVVEDCDHEVRGLWRSRDRVYAFAVPRDMRTARVWWHTSRSNGSLVLRSRTPPHLADGKPWPAQSTTVEMAPGLFFNQPVAGGSVEADIAVGKKTMRFEGSGGHGRLWATDSWFNICDGWFIVRAFAGPYVVAYWEPVSRIERGISFYSAQLFRDGQLLVGTQVGGRPSDGDDDSSSSDYVVLTPDFGGNVSGTLADRSTGRIIEFGKPAEARKWTFELTHRRKMFEMGLGGGKGLTGFIDHVAGGEIGGEQFEGNGFFEQVALPDEIKRWQIWVVYGIGFLGRWKSVLLNYISTLI